MPQVVKILTTLKVHDLLTYNMDTVGFEVEVYKMDTEIYGNGVDSSLPAQAVTDGKIIGSPVRSATIGGHKERFMVRSSEHVFTGLEKYKYYIVRYRAVTSDGRYSEWYQEKEKIGDTTFTATLSNKSVVSDNGTIKASFDIASLPSDYKEVHWFVRDSASPPDKTTAPDYVTTAYSGTGSFSLDITAYSQKYIYVLVLDLSRNRHASTAELIGSVAALADPPTPTLTYEDGIVRAEISYNHTATPDVVKFEFQLTKDGGSTYTKYPVAVPPNASGTFTTAVEIPSESGKTFAIDVRAVNSIQMNSNWSSQASIVCPSEMVVVDQNADIFHMDKMGYGSVRGVYPTVINGVPQLRGEYFSKFGGAIEFAEGTKNLLGNGAFELGSYAINNLPTNWGVTGWAGTYTKEWRNEPTPFGNYFVRMITTSTADRAAWIQYCNVSTSTTYEISAYVRVDKYVAGHVYLSVAQGGGYLHVASHDSNSDGWVRLVGTYTTNGTDSTMGIRLWNEYCSATVDWCGVQVEQKSYPTPFDTINNDGATARTLQYIKLPTANLIDQNAGSISAWIIPDWNYNVVDVNYNWFFSIYTSATDYFEVNYTKYSNAFKWRVEMSDGTSTDFYAPQVAFNRNDRIFITITWDSTNVYLYINGGNKASGIKRNYTLKSYIMVGARDSGGGSLNGCIDELIFWKGRTLTDNEVKKLYELEVPNQHPNPTKAVAPVVVPASDFIYDQPSSQGQLSNHTFSQLQQRITIRETG